jgi:Fe2+ transport system protein FeoA
MKEKETGKGPRAEMVEDKATEKMKKRLSDLGLIVNTGKADKPEEKGGKK